MKRQGVIPLIVLLVLLAAVLYVALFGLSIGIYEVKPMAQLIKEQKLGLDLTGGFSAVYQAKDTSIEDFDSKMESAVNVYRERLDGKGMTEATVTRQDQDKIRVEIPSTQQDPNTITDYLGTPAQLEWRDEDGNAVVRGENIQSAKAGYYDGKYVVSFELDEEGTEAFADLTTQYAGTGQSIGIYLDGELISAPVVNSAITTGKGEIEGNFTAESATELAAQIESGAIPLEMEEIEVRSISATLGVDALDKGVLAGAIGVAIIMIFMLIVYRLPGLMADIALVIYMLITFFCILTMPGVQLTLPGIAGVILSIGMAVDANVIIFERIKEEMRLGKSIRTSVENGFKKAFSAILDSNITTLIAAFVLMIFGAGSVKGFAYTLAIGIGASMITAVFITRYLLRLVVKMNITNPKFYAGMGGKNNENR